jgi:hypothetical protein
VFPVRVTNQRQNGCRSADNRAVNRIALQSTTRVERLAALYGEMLANRRDDLRIARAIGDLLLELPRREWAAEARSAGIKKSLQTLDDYVLVAEKWEIVQRAGAESIRQAKNVIRAIENQNGNAIPEKRRFRLQVDNANPDVLAHALGTVRGRAVSITIHVTRDAPHKVVGQRRLPFP